MYNQRAKVGVGAGGGSSAVGCTEGCASCRLWCVFLADRRFRTWVLRGAEGAPGTLPLRVLTVERGAARHWLRGPLPFLAFPEYLSPAPAARAPPAAVRSGHFFPSAVERSAVLLRVCFSLSASFGRSTNPACKMPLGTHPGTSTEEAT